MTNAAELLPAITSTEIVEFREFEKNLSEYKDRYEGIIYDLTVPEQDKQARSDKLAIGKVIAKLDGVHKDIKAPLKERVDLLDGERKRIKDQLLTLQDGIKSQISDHEAALKAVQDDLLRRASEFRDLAEFQIAPTSSVVQDRITAIKSRIIDDSYGEFEALAALNKDKSLQLLEPMLLGLQAQEKAAIDAEAERVAAGEKARTEREEKIAEEATERAKVAATEAAEKAQRDKEAAEHAETEKRMANRAHKVKINRAAMAALIEHAKISESQAKAVVIAIAENKVPAFWIKY